MTQAKERPIAFSAPMVRAILSDETTVTHKQVKVQPRSKADIGSFGVGQPFIRNQDVTKGNAECPYGRPGDRLWVRETWRGVVKINRPDSPLELGVASYIPDREECYRTEYAATESRGRDPWRSSSQMPRWASRILLEITDVRVIGVGQPKEWFWVIEFKRVTP